MSENPCRVITKIVYCSRFHDVITCYKIEVLLICVLNWQDVLLLPCTCHNGFIFKDLRHWKSPLYSSSSSWLIYFPPLSLLLNFLKLFLWLFCSCFLDPTLFQRFCLILLNISPCVFVIVCLNAFGYSPVRHLFCTYYIHAYNRVYNGHDMKQKNLLPIINYF